MQPAKLKNLSWYENSALLHASRAAVHTHTQISKFGLNAVTAELLSSDEYSKQSTSLQSRLLQVLILGLPYLHQANE